MMKSLISLIFIVLLDAAITAKTPNPLKICHRKVGNFQECLRDAIIDVMKHSKKANPTIGLKRLDPYVVEEFSVRAGNQGTVNFDQNYKNSSLYGLSDINIKSAVMDFDKNVLKWDTVVPLVEVKGVYDFSGRLLLLPLQGHGDYHFVITNLAIVSEIYFEEFIKNDRKYYKVIDVKTKLDMENMHFQLNNLFNGDKQLGDNLNQVLNENWRAVYEDVHEGYETLFSTIIKTETSSIFSRLAIDELFPE